MTVVQSGLYDFPKEADGPRGSELHLVTKRDFNAENEKLASC